MSLEAFKLPSFAVARNLAAQGVPVRVFQFSCDLPGLDGRPGATHTGDMPFLFRNPARRDLAGLGDVELAAWGPEVGRIMGALYAAFMRDGEPGPSWPRFDEAGWNVLWFGREVEARPGLLRREVGACGRVGPTGLGRLEDVLVGNTRRALGTAP